MSNRVSLSKLDWDKLGEHLLWVAAQALRDSLAKRCGAPAESFTIKITDPKAARVETRDPKLVAREIGTPDRPPRSFVKLPREDLDRLKSLLHESLRQGEL